MAAIGGYTMTGWQGDDFEPASFDVAPLPPPPGASGVAFAIGAENVPAVRCQTGFDASPDRPSADAIEETVKALKGTPVTVINPRGVQFDNVMVVDVRTRLAYNTPTGYWRLLMTWHMQPEVP